MNFEQYKIRSERCTVHSVTVTDKDCHTFNAGPVYFNNELHSAKGIQLKDFNHTYVADKDGNMWTTDQHGNPKRRSVFKYISED